MDRPLLNWRLIKATSCELCELFIHAASIRVMQPCNVPKAKKINWTTKHATRLRRSKKIWCAFHWGRSRESIACDSTHSLHTRVQTEGESSTTDLAGYTWRETIPRSYHWLSRSPTRMQSWFCICTTLLMMLWNGWNQPLVSKNRSPPSTFPLSKL